MYSIKLRTIRIDKWYYEMGPTIETQEDNEWEKRKKHNWINSNIGSVLEGERNWPRLGKEWKCKKREKTKIEEREKYKNNKWANEDVGRNGPNHKEGLGNGQKGKRQKRERMRVK